MVQKTQKQILAEHDATLNQLAAAIAELAAGQKALLERMSPAAKPVEELPPPKRQPAGTVIHNGLEPQTFTCNAEDSFTFQPGLNTNVPAMFVQMYENWQADCREAEEHAKQLAEHKGFAEQQQLLARTKSPGR